jgi:16S rRNA (cytosine1402-N4)-methyltransferase
LGTWTCPGKSVSHLARGSKPRLRLPTPRQPDRSVNPLIPERVIRTLGGARRSGPAFHGPMVATIAMNHPFPVHVPVMSDEVVHWLQPQPGGVFVDGTLGGGGHTRALAEQVGSSGRVIALDRDPAAVAAAESNLAGLPVEVVETNFADIPEILEQLEVAAVDGVLLDLGLSSDQLADPERGFSFSADGPLDLRFDPTTGESAARLVNRMNVEHLATLIYRYGEERYSRRIARAIERQRRKQPIESAAELAELVRRCVPSSRAGHRIDPATRTFQALRIAVNDELKWLEVALKRIPECLKPGGRLVVISFHSLEDRRVKEAFRDDPRGQALTKKPLRPTPEEVDVNPRARSAKLRVAERV